MADILNMRDILAKAAAADCVEGSEDQLASDFSHRHADDLRYCAQWAKWLHWDGARWRQEPTLAVYDLARVVCKDYSRALDDRKLAHSKTVHGVVWLARSDRRHAAVVEQWDCNPWLLNTPNGTVALPQGRLQPHRKADYLTKVTAAKAGGECPRWQSFLDRIMGEDADLAAYLQRVAGYCLTGSTREHALFFCYGTGANGKGVFIEHAESGARRLRGHSADGDVLLQIATGIPPTSPACAAPGSYVRRKCRKSAGGMPSRSRR